MPEAEIKEHKGVLNQADQGRLRFWDYWKLETDRGRQVWKFSVPEHLSHIQTEEDWQSADAQEFLSQMKEAFRYDKAQQPHAADLVYRIQAARNKGFTPLHENASNNLLDRVKNAASKGFHFYQALQTEHGNWPGDYGGPLFLLPGMITVSHITKSPLPAPHQVLCAQYMLNMQNEDGGWGLHIEGKSTMLGTVLQYVALRLLGESAEKEEMTRARKWIHKNGGANFIPSWGKFYLCVLGVYEWKGYNSILPEIWMLPESLPIHPSKYWCHARMVHMPMAYCYANKVVGEEDNLVLALRNELYTTSYEKINWKKARNQFCEVDIYTPHHWLLNTATRFMNMYEGFYSKSLRKKTTRFLLEQMERENENTYHINLGPVNHIINALCMFHAYGKDSDAFKNQKDRWGDYLWLAEDGMKMNGYNGSQFWDTNFAALALMEDGMEKDFPEMAKGVYRFLDDQQIKHEVENRGDCHRAIRKGGWAFSTIHQGWPITDCTAEGMKTSIKYMHSGLLGDDEKTINKERLKDSVNLLLAYQNRDGGWASYEPTRGPKWLEKLNAAEVFGDIMIDYSYVECTSACIQGLAKFRSEYNDYRLNDIHMAIRRGNSFLKSIQREDGSWMGAWAVCFTYATWFGIEGLLASGENNLESERSSSHIKRACDFLLAIQKEDGGWGEHFESCVQKKYVEHPNSQVTNTAWALLALMAAKHPDKNSIEKGIQFLLSKQDEWGDFPQQQISGVFNFNCMITYTAYRNVFPLWALSRYYRLFNQ